MAKPSMHVVREEEAGSRLDRMLVVWLKGLNFGAVQKLCRTGQVRLNGRRVKGNERLELGQEVRLPPHETMTPQVGEDASSYRLTAKDRQLLEEAILYQDKAMVAINKPAGLPSQAGSGHTKSLDRMMVAYFALHMPHLTPRLVHRLDKATTGVLVFALNRQAAANLSHSFANRQAQKTYWAVVKGAPLEKEGLLDFNLEKTRFADGQEKIQVRRKGERGQEALTEYKCLKRYKNGNQLIEVLPKTGRMHQIRAHFSAMGCPLVGDKKYGGEGYVYKGKGAMLLHAKILRLPHPEGGKTLVLSAPLSAGFEAYLETMAQGGK